MTRQLALEIDNAGLAPGEVGKAESKQRTDRTEPASIRLAQWWGRQACTCYGEGRCLCCRRFDRAISAHQARVAAAGGC